MRLNCSVTYRSALKWSFIESLLWSYNLFSLQGIMCLAAVPLLAGKSVHSASGFCRLVSCWKLDLLWIHFIAADNPHNNQFSNKQAFSRTWNNTVTSGFTFWISQAEVIKLHCHCNKRKMEKMKAVNAQCWIHHGRLNKQLSRYWSKETSEGFVSEISVTRHNILAISEGSSESHICYSHLFVLWRVNE